jgi:hypothetical protein
VLFAMARLDPDSVGGAVDTEERNLHIAGEEETLAPGGIAIIPRGVPHASMVTTATARMLCLQTLGGGEAFYQHASEPAGDVTPRTNDGNPRTC